MSPVRPATALLVGAVVAVLAYAGLRGWVDAGHAYPHPSLLELLALALIGATALVLGRRVRRMALGLPGSRVEPITAARTFVLAQASVVTGAALTGLHLAGAVVLWPQATEAGAWGGLTRTLLLALVSAVLAVVGLVVQRWCRRRHDPDEQDTP